MGFFSPVADPVKDRYYDGFVKDMASQQGKAFAVTGTTSGTGFEAAKALASRGGQVLCLNRPSERATASLAKLKEVCAEGGTVEQVDCDLQDFASVRGAVETVKKATASTGVYGILNNAGVMTLKGVPTKDGYEIQMQTNHLSHFLLTIGLMPSLEQAAAQYGDARVVTMTSGARNMPPSPIEAKYVQPYTEGVDLGDDGQMARSKRYQQSKLANCVFTLALKDKLAAKGSKVKAILTHPGGSWTSLTANTAAHSPGTFMDSKFAMRTMKMFMQGQGDGALPMLASVTAPEAESGDFYCPSVVGVIGMMVGEEVTGPPAKMDWAKRGDKEKFLKDPECHKTLWDCSEAATGLSF